MDNFTDHEKSGAVWMFAKPEWDIAETRCYSKEVYKRGEALADFVRSYNIKPGDIVVEFRAEEHTVKCIPLYSI